jgi:hypothetical protein
MARDEHGYPVPVAAGRQDSDDGESSTIWALYSTDDPDVAAIVSECDDNELCASEMTGWSGMYRGAGQWFWNDPWAKRVRKHVLVRMDGGLDV